MAASIGLPQDCVAFAVNLLHHRGPDAYGLRSCGDVVLGHTRLAILDLDARSNQPFHYGETTISYNGELWNYRALRELLENMWGATFETEGDTEVVAAALDVWGVEALAKMHGMFALAWTYDGSTLMLARDRFGEMPLHLGAVGEGILNEGWAAASELKALQAMGVREAEWVEPGGVVFLRPGEIPTGTLYYDAPSIPNDQFSSRERAPSRSRLRDAIAQGAEERAISDVPVCTLLSGGIDSAAVAYHLRQYVPGLVAFVAKPVSSKMGRDLKCARLTAEALEIPLVEVLVPPPRQKDLLEVIRHIELPLKAQVEIGWPCLALAREMRANGFKVTFSGEGADELFASYGFAYHALDGENPVDWHAYRKGLFLRQHRGNFARVNKVFMAHGVEARLPFLHVPLVEYLLGLRRDVVQDGRRRPKAIIQDAYEGLLPDEVVRRTKLAFQKGLNYDDWIRQVVGSDPAMAYRNAWHSMYGGETNAA